MAADAVARLRVVPLFSACSDKELRFIAAHVEELDFPAGTVLCREGRPGGDFFVILDGQAEVEGRHGKATLGPGEFFGEIALLDHGPRTATVTAATPLRCLVLGPPQFRDVLHSNAAIAVKMLHVVTQRLRAETELHHD